MSCKSTPFELRLSQELILLLKSIFIFIRYPAGFVYIFSLLYSITGQGHELRVAQYIFALIYLLNLALVIRICHKTAKVHYVYVLLGCFNFNEGFIIYSACSNT